MEQLFYEILYVKLFRQWTTQMPGNTEKLKEEEGSGVEAEIIF